LERWKAGLKKISPQKRLAEFLQQRKTTQLAKKRSRSKSIWSQVEEDYERRKALERYARQQKAMLTDAYKKQGAVKHQERAARRQQSASVSGVGNLFGGSASVPPAKARSLTKKQKSMFPEGYFEEMESRGNDPFGY
jgi:hypothetical protein